ncbi:hypothetical protein CEQ90_15475 [Lewinellaceae bacterium SD302]|nr:hypothetical protein CEQ90_15475 [Lewinellaceae bacterium SD302]
MAKLKIYVVEDAPDFRAELEGMLREMGYQNYALFADIESTEAAFAENRPDLVILDIFLGGQPVGLELAASLKERQVPVVFITSSKDRSVYEKAALSLPDAYLVKPFDTLSLQAAIERSFIQRGNPVFIGHVINQWHKQQMIKEYLFVRKNSALVKLCINEINLIEADGNYCYLHYEGKKYAVKSSLRSIKELLLDGPFLQVNRSRIINFKSISEIAFADAIIKTTQGSYTIGNAYRKEIESWINRI